MNGDVDIASVASLLADPGRCRMLLALFDGRALPASRLAREAGIAPSTASVHLAKLVDARLLIEVQAPPNHGRHRFFRLASSEIADLLEILARVAPATPIRSLRESTKATALRRARTCYDHLAGELGVALTAALLERRILVERDGTCLLTEPGEKWLVDFGIDVPLLRAHRRPLIRTCIDWSEQRPHLAGALGAALAERFLERGWIRRSPHSRAVHLTEDGCSMLASRFGVALDAPNGSGVAVD